jgi:hypothetical protein
MSKPDPFRANEVPVDRGFLAPLATYADGQTELAWPTFPVGAVIDGLRSFGSEGYDTPEAIRKNAGAAFDVAGGAVMGGAGVGLAGGLADNAVGSAGGKLARGASDLPMDLYSRMARAKEMGFDTERPVYHGTDQAFESFDDMAKPGNAAMGHSRGAYFTDSEKFASDYGPNVGQYFVKDGKMLDLPKFSNASDLAKIFGDDILKIPGIPDRAESYWFFKDGPAYRGSESDRVGSEMKRRAMEAGYVGARFPEMKANTTVIFDPRNIRSTSAAFDPAKSDSANLLAANAKSGAAVPLLQNALERAQPQGIRAYHGSPHDFDRFSLDKIGTGEGAQAYGHGLYFADSEDVARNYRDALSRGDPKDPVFNSYDLIRNGLPKEEARQLFQEIIDDGAKSWPAEGKRQERLDFARRSLEAIDSGAVDQYKSPGKMYEVNIKANPEDFLDWDKPLSQQSEAVRKALEQYGIRDGYQVLTNQGRSEIFPTLEDAAAAGPRLGSTGISRTDPLGSNILESRQLVPGDYTDKAAATAKLREAGIPGIRYLDGMSRGAGEGSSNYVVFDDQLVDILRKYANAPTGAAIPAGMEASQGQDTDPALVEYLRLTGQIPY